MPAIRDLKGRPVEETVDSRLVSFAPEPQGQVGDGEREAIRKAVEKVTALRGPRPEREESSMGSPSIPMGGNTLTWNAPLPLPADMEAGLHALEETLLSLEENARLIRGQIVAIRLRAEKDAGKLARLAELLKQIGE